MANPLGARQNAQFKAVCTAPSINRTPVGNSTPPLPYAVSQDLANAVGTVASVRFYGDPVYVFDQSTQPSCRGDERGTRKGVKSGTTGGEVKPLKGSSTLRVGGKPVVREGDPCTLNGGNCPGIYVTQSAPGSTIQEGAPSGDANPPVQPETPKETSWWQKASPWVHGVLGVASFVPGLSVATGAADAAIYAGEGNAVEATLAAASMIPGGKIVTTAGKVVKGAAGMVKGARAAEDAARLAQAAKAAKEAEEAAKAARLAKEAKEAEEAAKLGKAPGEPPKSPGDGAKIKSKGKRSNEAGKCGEWLAKLDMAKEGFDEIVAVQNNSNQGVDLVGRNSKTGEVKVWEVKATETGTAPPLRGDQARMGGAEYAKDRLGRASRGAGNYGKVEAAMEAGKEATKWIGSATRKGQPVTYEKREVFVDDLEKGCAKKPGRPSRSTPWIGK